ncbi:peptidylprolyl isomerase [Neorhizobium sp. Rsf11]|uniref:Parvulin-like PPIase n=1 Tax=Neorhizobium phenanthreniclasticum TaxID=3157917 RepID=A0ABV0MFC5_9HYPH
MVKRLLKEPLVHFFLIALAIFAMHGVVGDKSVPAPDVIVVTASKVEQMGSVFTKTWQRPPTGRELKGLIDDHVREEILVREALALGLDKDDTVIRRRLRQKMEFLVIDEADAPVPTDAELNVYLNAHPGAFETDPMLAFQQVFLNPERQGDAIARNAASTLEALATIPSTDPASLGDVTQLPPVVELTGKTAIAQMFGGEFAEALDKVPVGQWIGPVASGFGLHLVRVTERKPGRLPALGDVRAAVMREWANDRRVALEDRRFAEALKRYDVTIENLAVARTVP